jgi:hypothetical protein
MGPVVVRKNPIKIRSFGSSFGREIFTLAANILPNQYASW